MGPLKAPVSFFEDLLLYSTDWFRYSDIIAVNASQPGRAAVCWGDNTPDPERGYLKNCAWKHIQSWYGTPRYWEARAHMNPIFFA